MRTVNRREFTAKSNITCKALFRITTIVTSMTIGSTSLRAACQLDATAPTPLGGVKLQVIAFGDSLLDVISGPQKIGYAKVNL
jgi:hypothetical protein